MNLDRRTLVEAILAFLQGEDLLTRDHIRRELEREIDAAGPEALVALRDRLDTAAAEWTFYPRDPLAQHIHHVLADAIIEPASALVDVVHAAPVGLDPVVIVANHLSYADANLIEILCHRAGLVALANRLTAVAGPKVFTSRTRRFSSLCFGTIRVAQSADVASEEAVMTPREVARAARQAIDCAHARLAAGDALLLFPEGARSRSTSMQPLLPAVTRYWAAGDPWILPMGVTGTDTLFPAADTRLHRSVVTVRVGVPFRAAALEAATAANRRLMIDAVGVAIAELLPESYRGVYADDRAGIADAAAALMAARTDSVGTAARGLR